MPEVQKPVLEHPTEETARQDAQGLTPSISRTTTLPESNDVVKLVTSVTSDEPVWLDAEHTRFTWRGVRPWQEDPDFSESLDVC